MDGNQYKRRWINNNFEIGTKNKKKEAILVHLIERISWWMVNGEGWRMRIKNINKHYKSTVSQLKISRSFIVLECLWFNVHLCLLDHWTFHFEIVLSFYVSLGDWTTWLPRIDKTSIFTSHQSTKRWIESIIYCLDRIFLNFIWNFHCLLAIYNAQYSQ